jgi:hypothetical protein
MRSGLCRSSKSAIQRRADLAVNHPIQRNAIPRTAKTRHYQAHLNRTLDVELSPRCLKQRAPAPDIGRNRTVSEAKDGSAYGRPPLRKSSIGVGAALLTETDMAAITATGVIVPFR